MSRLSFIVIAAFLIFSCDKLTKTAEYTLNRYKASSPSMSPAIPVGTSFSVLSADTFELNQIIVFHPPSLHFRGLDTTSYWVCRLVGLPGDQLQMKGGKLFRNNAPYESPVRLKHSYRVTTSMPLNEKRMEDFEYGLVGSDEYLFYLSDDELPSLKKNKAIVSIESGILNTEDEEIGGKIFVGGNRDNWGPLTIPPMHYFVLGDNRHNALDSRYLGFIPKGNIKGFAVVKN